MDFKESLARLKKSTELKYFLNEHKDAYLCTAFFIIDFHGNQNSLQINFQFDEGKIAAFSMGEQITFKIEDLLVKKTIPKLKEKIKTDIEEVVLAAKKEVKKHDDKTKISKMMAILGTEDKVTLWNITCFMDGMKIINVHIDANSGKILKSQKMMISEFFNKPADYIG